MTFHPKMQFNELKSHLLEFEQYEISLTRVLSSQEIHDFFYFIIHDNQILKVNYIPLKKKEKEKFFNYNSTLAFVNDTEKSFLDRFNDSTKLDFKIFIYAIPRNKKTKNDFKTLYGLYHSLTRSFSFNLYFETLNKNLIFIKYFFALFFSAYSSYLYLALHDIGIPIQFTTDINIILSIIGFLLIGFVAFFTFIPLILLVIIHYSDSIFPYAIVIILFSYIIILIADKIAWVVTYKLIKQSGEFIGHFFVGLLSPKVFIGILGFILLIPIMYLADTIRLHHSNSQFGRPTFLYSLYHNFTGYPKIAEIDDKKIIVTGNDAVNYVTYEVNSTLDYLYDTNKSSNFEQLCRNINGDYKNSDSIIYEVLAHSLKNKPANATLLNVKQKPLTLIPFSLESIDINTTILKHDCQIFLKNK